MFAAVYIGSYLLHIFTPPTPEQFVEAIQNADKNKVAFCLQRELSPEVIQLKKNTQGLLGSEHEEIETVFPLHEAVSKGHKDIVLFLLENGAKKSINALSEKNKKTPLFFPVEKGDTEMAELLIKQNANVNKKIKMDSNRELNPLSIAVANGDIDMAKLLLLHGATESINVLSQPTEYLERFQTPLQCALKKQDKKMMDLLINQKECNVSAVDNNGNTVLHLVLRDDIDSIKKFLEANADPNVLNNKGKTPLASTSGIEKTRLLLKFNANPNLRGENTAPPLVNVIRHNNCQDRGAQVESLLNAKARVDDQDQQGNAAIHIAVDQGEESMVDLLLKVKANVALQNKERETAIHKAASKQGGLTLFHKLLAAVSEIDHFSKRDNSGNTPLNVAALACRDKKVGMLFIRGAQLDDKHANDKTLLHKVVDRKDPDIILESAIYTAVTQSEFNRALSDALENIKLLRVQDETKRIMVENLERNLQTVPGKVEIMEEYGVFPRGTYVQHQGVCCRVERCRVSERPLIRQAPFNQDTMCEHEKTAAYLIEFGAPINQKDEKGKTPLEYCSVEHAAIAEKLLEKGALVAPGLKEQKPWLECVETNIERQRFLIGESAV